MVFKQFSGHSFTSDGGKGGCNICTWRLTALPDLPLLSQMTTAVTPQALRPQADGIGQLVGPLSRRLTNLHLSQQDPEVLLDACKDADMQLDCMVIDHRMYTYLDR